MILRTRDIIGQIRQGEIPKGYIRTVSGISPTDWKRYTFGDIYTERKEPGSEELPLLMVSIHSGVSDGEVDEEELPKKVKRIEDKSQYKKAVSGDLVFNMMRAWQGAIGTVRTTGMVSPAYIVAKPNDKVYPLFMDYYTRTPQMINQINRQSYGVTDFRKRLYWDSFAPIGCTLPPIEEQRKIAAILTTQDKVIELKEKCLAEKQRQKKYLMQQLLTGEKRLPGFVGKWKIFGFNEIFTTISTKDHQINKAEYETEGRYPVVDQGKQLIAGYSNKTGKVLVCPKDGLVVFGDHTREIKFINFDFIVGADGTQLLTAKSENAGIKYLFYYLLNKEIHSDGYSRHFKYVKEFTYRLPPLKEQSAIVKILSAADREIDLIRQDIEQEKQKKKALMQLLLTGIVRVKT